MDRSQKVLTITLGIWVVLLLACFTMLGAGCGSEEPLPALANGEACVPDTQPLCESGLCLDEFTDEQEIVGGICTDECVWNQEGTDTCVDEEVCLRYRPTGEKHCYQLCAQEEECRTDEDWTCMCIDFFCTRKACVPPL